jgi:hypothetical protein
VDIQGFLAVFIEYSNTSLNSTKIKVLEVKITPLLQVTNWQSKRPA